MNELRKILIKRALQKLGYVPPTDPSMMAGGMGAPPPQGAPMGGPMGGGPMGGLPGGGLPPLDALFGGGAGGAGGQPGAAPPPDMGGAPPGGGDMGGLPPTDMSGVEPTPPGGAASDAVTQLQSAIAILREGLKQLERAADALSGKGGSKSASYHGPFYGYFPAHPDPIQEIVMFLNSLG